MGRHSNIILTDGEGAIIDGLKHLSPSMNSYRTVLPGYDYKLPPAQEKFRRSLRMKRTFCVISVFRKDGLTSRSSDISPEFLRCLQKKSFTERALLTK